MDNKKMVWIGRVLSALACVPFVMSALMKIVPSVNPQMPEQMAKMGVPAELLMVFATLEIMCIIVYAIPRTAVLGAILFTGYLGGAIMTHVRVHDSVVIHVVLGVMIWLGLFLREPRLRELIPLRK